MLPLCEVNGWLARPNTHLNRNIHISNGANHYYASRDLCSVGDILIGPLFGRV